jgi:hypothetical protein
MDALLSSTTAYYSHLLRHPRTRDNRSHPVDPRTYFYETNVLLVAELELAAGSIRASPKTTISLGDSSSY